MNFNRFLTTALLASAAARAGGAEALAPAEIKDARLRALQTKHLTELNAAAAEITAHPYPVKFVLSRTLDVSGKLLDATDHRAIQFSTFDKQIVLLVMGNYTAAYPPQTPSQDRVRRTYLDVAVPILKTLFPRLADEPELGAVVMELSHHVRRGDILAIDRYENPVFVLPRALARRIAETGDPAEQLAALSEAKIYVDAKVVPFPAAAAVPAAVGGARSAPAPAPAPAPVEAKAVNAPPASTSEKVSAPVPETRPEDRPVAQQPVPHPVNPPVLERAAVDRMSRELDAQAHFDPSAQPELATFRGASYLRIPLATALTADDAGSQYRLAALAFDRHISHLIRLVLPYFKDAGFDGIAFRTTVTAGSSPAETVEFLFPLGELRRYENYDITGQQLISAGFVLINGERAGLDLQSAENVKP